MATLWISRRECEEGTLPCRCLKCGRRATGFVEQDFFGTLFWTSPVSFLISLLGGWESARLHVPICETHRDYWHNRRLILGAAFLAGLLCCGLAVIAWFLVQSGAGAAFAPGDWLTAVMLFVSSLVTIGLFLIPFGYAGIRALEVHEDSIWLTNVHPDAVHQGDVDAPLGDLLHDGTLSKFDPNRPRWLDRTRRQE
jgi:hypothetical protein